MKFWGVLYSKNNKISDTSISKQVFKCGNRTKRSTKITLLTGFNGSGGNSLYLQLFQKPNKQEVGLYDKGCK